ncbi:hypothetical protein AB0J86_20955 [Micromonospora sp. NPDC049559]|uniref:hypothetical protein n=1 Tax=Micromonospora sp. NPDC049559 TaxID=3155923 RepID=UPI0034484265
MTTTIIQAVGAAEGAAETVRATCLRIAEAADRAGAELRGGRNPLPRAALTRWESALTESWQALALVHTGLSAARRLPGAPAYAVGNVLDGLAAAREAAELAAGDAAWVRRGLAVAEDRLRRAGADQPTALATADRWGAACARLDLVAARLAIGVRALERYADQLAPGEHPPPPPAALSTPPEPAERRAGVASAGALLRRAHGWRGWRAFLARVRYEVYRELARSIPW